MINEYASQSAERPARNGYVHQPVFRRLRGYAFDPSLSTQLETALINETAFKVRWEELQPGPVGEYVEVVDYDPASARFYEPVDLNDKAVLAQDGLAPSEGSPQFHQQMVYAVAMTTIANFERALGRWAMWAHRGRKEDEGYVPRLRIYPHALREANAFYSPSKKALLFGYFPAGADDPGGQLPGGMVFTCLSHDVVAHETTHALLDGMHRRFIEADQPDVLAFHEAFADIVALFQHFSFPEVLRHQISKTRGDLASQSLLGELAQQFGKAIGHYGALRNAIGRVNPETGRWEQLRPDPDEYRTVMEPHARGAILVAAVFEAFLSIYRSRVADLLRIATSGTGVLPEGALHPDLVNRLAAEAAKAANHVLHICIRALDYCPPIGITFGEYLRALITADYDLVPDDDLGYRVAFVEAFRRRGIYPRDLRTLSSESLRWRGAIRREDQQHFEEIAEKLRSFMGKAEFFKDREDAHRKTIEIKRKLYHLIRSELAHTPVFEEITGLALSASCPFTDIKRKEDGQPVFEVHSLRAARRVGPDGQKLNQMVVSITQKRTIPLDKAAPPLVVAEEADLATAGDDTPPPGTFYFRGGCTLIFDLDSLELRYAIKKSVADEQRLARHRAHLTDGINTSLRATYFGGLNGGTFGEPFAVMHRGL
jgi:hypothetical protein